VLGLRRTRIGPIADPKMPPGAWRDLSPREVAALRRAAGIV
jgi:16S rRNA U516 pseudouridylate synthase RsuA-like enzyme